MATIAYLRVSTQNQDLKNQEHQILKYAHDKGFRIDRWIQAKVSSRRSAIYRKLDELLNSLDQGDKVIVAELSRLGRSISQVVILIQELIDKKIGLVSIKENISLVGQPDMTTKIQISLFSLMADIERDLISERTKAGLENARAKGKKLGRPKGSRSSILDERKEEISHLLDLGVSKASIAKILRVSGPAISYYIKTRGLA